MKIKVDGQDYEYDENRLMLTEAMEIQEKTGLNLKRWQAGLSEMDAYAVKALLYLLKKRAGESPDWQTLDCNIAAIDFGDDEEPASPTPAES